MNRKEKLVLIKNAAANVVRGGSAAMVAIILPPFLARIMSADSYGAWSLVLQFSAYVGYLDFGIQTAVGRFVAHANEKGDAGYRDRIVSTSFAALIAAGILAIGGSIGIVALLPHIFRQMPAALVGDARVALLLVAGSLAVGLPASVFSGIFVGLQRNEVPAAVIGGSRIVGAVCLILVLRHGGNLVSMGAAVATVNLASYLIQYWLYRRLSGGTRLSRKLVSLTAGHELFDYCVSLTVWSFATLMVLGLDLTLVGFFDFRSVAYYAVAATLITFILGLQNAIFGTLIPVAAVLEARDDTSELGAILVSTTRYGMFLLFASGVPLLIATRPILSAWVGPEYASHASVILRVLVIANIIRLSAVPYAMLLVGTGQQKLVTVSPLVEGFSNLAVSVTLGALWGAVGVAVGTVVGSTVGILCNFFYNMPRSRRIAATRLNYLAEGYLRPLVCVSPFFLVYMLRAGSSVLATVSESRCMLLALMVSLGAIWRVGVSAEERRAVLTWIGVSVGSRAGTQSY
jgi:O-antigen/teichoic acid export membrane protein